MITEKSLIILPFDFNLKNMLPSVVNSFRELMNLEFIESNSNIMTFASLIAYFYNFQEGNENKHEDGNGCENERNVKIITCQELKIKYFNGKNYNTNILLKYLIIMYDPQERIKRCIQNNDESSISNYLSTFPSIEINSDYIENLKIKGSKIFNF